MGVVADDFDGQGHLNNAAIVRHLNELRVGYVRERIGPTWGEWLRATGSVVAAREVHVSYESEGFPHEQFVGATRLRRRDGRAAIVEQLVVEAASARVIARAWVVQLLARDGRAIDWPELYWELATAAEGRPIPFRARVERPRWGPPAWPEPETA
jgi:acyl-CoA thioesterase FadM